MSDLVSWWCCSRFQFIRCRLCHLTDLLCFFFFNNNKKMLVTEEESLGDLVHWQSLCSVCRETGLWLYPSFLGRYYFLSCNRPYRYRKPHLCIREMNEYCG